mmetsp:Transcript_79839/g.247777  ORF Transcript_79839/g.247777 Transcript_79839/m.247777 type:complete len:379 (-) Transcript_79839:59-1195(-)
MSQGSPPQCRSPKKSQALGPTVTPSGPSGRRPSRSAHSRSQPQASSRGQRRGCGPSAWCTTRSSLKTSTSRRCSTARGPSSSPSSAVMVMAQKLLRRARARLTYLKRLWPPRRLACRQFCSVPPTCWRYSKLRISSMRTVANRLAAGSESKRCSSSLGVYASPCQLLGEYNSESATSSSGSKAASTPRRTKPLTPIGLGSKRSPLACSRCTSRLCAARWAASRTFRGERGLPRRLTENSGSTERSASSHSMARPAAGPSPSAPAERHAHSNTETAKASSSAVPRPRPSCVPNAAASATWAGPPRAATCAQRSCASGLCRRTLSGCTWSRLSGTVSCGGGGTGPATGACASLRTIFFVRLGVRCSLAAAARLSPRPAAA